MERLEIEGGHQVHGKVEVSGSKNASLPLMAASILARGVHTFNNIPRLKDVSTMMALLSHLGLEARWEGDGLIIENSGLSAEDAPYDLVKTMRASVLVLGPLVAARGHARVSLPGGCAIGARPINLHIKAMQQMGARVSVEGGYVDVHCDKLKGASIFFDTVTVTGTENAMMAAVLADGVTTIENAAREPEVIDLAKYLAKMGAKIRGAGTDTIVIEGVSSLMPSCHRVIPDRIEAATFVYAALATRGHVRIDGIEPRYIDHTIAQAVEAGAKLKIESNFIEVTMEVRPMSVDAVTAPFPGFATDLQAQLMAAMCLASGTSVIKETIFENRFMHVPELLRLGADIKVDGATAVVKGVKKLSGAPLMATDLRASASLVIAALAADGKSVIDRIYHLDRGYERMDDKLAKLGAKIRRIG